jgi:hypothetical protein
MSDQNVGKNIEGRIAMDYFVEAYEDVTGERLFLELKDEKPDFVCRQADGLLVAVELTKIMRDPEQAFYDRILNHHQYMSPDKAIDKIYEAVERKEIQRTKEDWLLSSDTILVLQLIDCPLATLKRFLDVDLRSDFYSYGFKEIWVADYTGINAYGDIELFCLHPLEHWGYYQRPNPYRKPYG